MTLKAAYSSSSGGSDILVANFSAKAIGFNVDFKNNSFDGGNTIESYLWEFGDTATSIIENPNHVFSGIGTYNVTLTVIDNVGNKNKTFKDVILVAANVPPSASFSATDSGLDVSFTDLSTDTDGVITSYLWDFGD